MQHCSNRRRFPCRRAQRALKTEFTCSTCRLSTWRSRMIYFMRKLLKSNSIVINWRRNIRNWLPTRMRILCRLYRSARRKRWKKIRTERWVEIWNFLFSFHIFFLHQSCAGAGAVMTSTDVIISSYKRRNCNPNRKSIRPQSANMTSLAKHFWFPPSLEIHSANSEMVFDVLFCAIFQIPFRIEDWTVFLLPRARRIYLSRA